MTARAGPSGLAAELPILSPRRAALQLAWPGIAENLIRVGAQTVILLFVGRLGAQALAAYGAAIQLVFMLFPVWQSLSIGTIALVSRRMGAGEPAEAAAFARQSLLVGAAIAALFGLAFAAYAETALGLLGATPEVAAIGAPYLRISGGANAAVTLLIIALAALRGAGDTRSPFLITAVTAGISVPVGYALLGVIGLPGVAIGWLSANLVGLVWTMLLLVRGRAGLRLGRRGWRPDLPRMRTLLGISLPASGDQTAITIGLLILSALALRLGTEPYAAHNIVGQIESISFLPCLGFATAASVLVGQSLGMEDVRRADRAAWAAAQTAVAWTSVAGLAMVVFAEPALALFSSDPKVIGAGAGALRIIGLGQPVQAINFVMGGALRGAGDTKFMMLATIANWFVVRLPIALVLTFVVGLGLVGVWLAIFIDYFVRSGVLIWRFRSHAWARLHL